jgi:hypothetical protein
MRELRLIIQRGLFGVTDLSADAIGKLYAVPLEAFTRERDALAAALKKADHAAQARAVRQLRRPSAALWAANQLAHTDTERLAAFLDGITQVQKTQLRAPRAAAEALTSQRRELQRLVLRAGELLAKQGSRATPAIERRISETLLGAAVDRVRADELRHGRLTQELAAPGFEVLAGPGRGDHLRLVSGGRTAPTRHPRSMNDERRDRLELDRQRQRDEAARQRDDAAQQKKQAALRQREEAAARKREEAAQRQREMAERRAAVEHAEEEARDLSTRLAAARQRLVEARRAAKSASRSGRRPSS